MEEIEVIEALEVIEDIEVMEVMEDIEVVEGWILIKNYKRIK